MALSNDLISQFVEITKKEPKKKEGTTVYGTVQEYSGALYVKIDGSDRLTPIQTTCNVKPGDRVTVFIKNHSATATGNLSSPSVGADDVKDLEDKVNDAADQISEFEIIIADKVSTAELEAERARIDELISENVTIKDTLTANKAQIEELIAKNVTIEGTLDAVNADIENLHATKLDTDIADIKYASIESLEAVDAYIRNLEADFGDFKDLTADKLLAIDAKIENLDANKISADEADIKYANIDFANIGKAAIENFFAKSGMIGDLVVGDGTITGTLVGVTIKGELIEGGTVVADKLVIKGEDGLYYKLNTDGETVTGEQTDYNSLNGKIITAKSITAEKINVKDLVAFGATIGGYTITNNALYSGVKETVDNATEGVYMDSTGQWSVGGSQNYIKYYKDAEDNYKLDISADSISLSSGESSFEDLIVDTQQEFYSSTSNVELIGGSWGTDPPTYQKGIYVWIRTLITYFDGTKKYTPSENGVCTMSEDNKEQIVIGPDEPEDKSVLWCDTHGDKPLLKKWNETEWELVNDVSDTISQIYDDMNSTIDQTASEIRTEVSETTYKKDEVDGFIEELTTSFNQTKDTFEFNFTQMQTNIDKNSDDLDAYKVLVDTYIQFSAEGISLGKRDDPFSAKLGTDRLSFLQDGTEIAYLSNNKLYITSTEVLNRFTVGNPDSGFFDWIPRANGNLGMKWRSN